jgi:DNA-binding response OmpR family regulator
MRSSGDIVLVVDDMPRSLGALCMDLEEGGYTVLVAADGASALERLELVTPDAVLMDAQMPGLDGFETCRRLKSHAAWSHIPVIFMTGLSETDHIVKGFDAGGVDYVVKPGAARDPCAQRAQRTHGARRDRHRRTRCVDGRHARAHRVALAAGTTLARRVLRRRCRVSRLAGRQRQRCGQRPAQFDA